MLLLSAGCECGGASGAGGSGSATPGSARARPAARRPVQTPGTAPSGAGIAVGPGGCAEGIAPLPSHVQRGLCYAHNYQQRGRHGYGSATSRETMQSLRGIGVRWLSLTPFGFMGALDDTEVHHVGDMAGGETDARMHAEIAAAQELGFRIVLKPHLWLRGGEWRGNLDPGSESRWAQWHDSYRQWIVRYARMAERHDVPIFVIGTELKSSALRFADRWRRIARAVRGVYDGDLVYAANWDAVPDITWWDAVDYIGVQFYPPLAETRHPSREAMDAKMDTYMRVLGGLVDKWDRPVLFTEVGYKAVHGTAVRPHTWPQELGDGREVSERAQARAYAAFVRGVRGHDWVRGIYWWKWFTNPEAGEGGPAGFSPRGNRAEAVLRAAYGSPQCD